MDVVELDPTDLPSPCEASEVLLFEVGMTTSMGTLVLLRYRELRCLISALHCRLNIELDGPWQ